MPSNTWPVANARAQNLIFIVLGWNLPLSKTVQVVFDWVVSVSVSVLAVISIENENVTQI